MIRWFKNIFKRPEVKKMVNAGIEKAVDKVETEILSRTVQRDIYDEFARRINRRINIPFLNEEQEHAFFKTALEVSGDLLIHRIKQNIPKI